MCSRSDIKEKLKLAITNANKKQTISLPVEVARQIILCIMDTDLEEKVVQSEIISKLTTKIEKDTQKMNTPLPVRPLGIPIPKGCENFLTGYCPTCGTGLWGKGTHYCHWCGQAVKWE